MKVQITAVSDEGSTRIEVTVEGWDLAPAYDIAEHIKSWQDKMPVSNLRQSVTGLTRACLKFATSREYSSRDQDLINLADEIVAENRRLKEKYPAFNLDIVRG